LKDRSYDWSFFCS